MENNNIFSVSKLYLITTTRRARIYEDTFRYVTEHFIAFKDLDGNYREVFSNYNFGIRFFDPAYIEYKSGIPYITSAFPLKNLSVFDGIDTIESNKLFLYLLNQNLYGRSALDY